MPNYLWSFAPSTPSYTSSTTTPQGSYNNGTAPSQNAIAPMPGFSNSGIINVVRDFYWTYSPAGDAGRAEVPRIQLTERRLKTNSLVAQLQYTLGAAKNGANAVAGDIRGGSCIAGLIAGLGSALGDVTGGIAQSTVNGITSNGTLAGAQSTMQDNNPTTTSSPFLQPYKNLYITEPTGWVYTLPYFDNNQSTSSNAFDETMAGAEGFFGAIKSSVQDYTSELADITTQLGSPTQYTFIEKTKFYQYASDNGESINVEFPLINTGAATYDDVVRNWQFLYLLVYQNRPGKTGLNTVEQPVIYEVNVPGTKFFPYCYISNLTVDFVGSRRELTLNIPSITSAVGSTGSSINDATGTSSINAIIPDAYKVSITLQSMTANTKNFMAHMVSSNNVIQTGTSTGPTFTSPIANGTGITTGR